MFRKNKSTTVYQARPYCKMRKDQRARRFSDLLAFVDGKLLKEVNNRNKYSRRIGWTKRRRQSEVDCSHLARSRGALQEVEEAHT